MYLEVHVVMFLVSHCDNWGDRNTLDSQRNTRAVPPGGKPLNTGPQKLQAHAATLTCVWVVSMSLQPWGNLMGRGGRGRSRPEVGFYSRRRGIQLEWYRHQIALGTARTAAASPDSLSKLQAAVLVNGFARVQRYNSSAKWGAPYFRNRTISTFPPIMGNRNANRCLDSRHLPAVGRWGDAQPQHIPKYRVEVGAHHPADHHTTLGSQRLRAPQSKSSGICPYFGLLFLIWSSTIRINKMPKLKTQITSI